MSDTIHPLVSVCMLAYNIEGFIAKAIEGVLHQKTSFPFELVIGEDSSRDGTRQVCETYAQQYPAIIRLLPETGNLGIAGNADRVLRQCRGKYIAICDGDDIWSDPLKLQAQVDFLEKNPDYGAVYSDVETITENDVPFKDPEHQGIREQYSSGDVFFQLLQGNFINNSTAVFRSAMLNDYEIDCDRNYYTHDHLLWLHIAVQSKIHFMDLKTTLYRKHSGGVTNSAEKLANNKMKFQYHLYNVLLDFDRHYSRLISANERMLVFRKIMSVLYRKENTFRMKARMLGLLPKYFPGVLNLAKMLLIKFGWDFFHTINDNVLTTNLESNA